MKSVLILGSDTRSFLSCVRSFGRKGFQVYVAECNDAITLKSKYIYENVDLGDFGNDHDEWCLNFAALIKKINFALILPVDDPSILKMRYYIKNCGEIPKLFLSDEKSEEILNDKELSYKLASILNIPVANTVIINQYKGLVEAIAVYGFPIVIKPHKSCASAESRKKDVVIIVENQDELKLYSGMIQEYLTKYGSLICQEFFAGVGCGVEVLAYHGRILLAFQHVRVHEPLKGGGSTSRKSVKLDERMYRDAERIVNELKYTGVLMVEFKFNENTNKYIFIETNARFWGSLPLAIQSGIDFPYSFYQMCVENKRKFDNQYQIGIYQHNFESDLFWKYSLLKNRKYLFCLKECIAEIIRELIRKEFIDEFAFDDIRVGYKVICLSVSSIYFKIKKKIICKFSHIIYSRPVSKISKQDKVLFVCYGNICRSAFAKLYRDSLTKDINSSKSAGYYYKAGRKMDSEIVEVIQNYDLATEQHKSQKIDISMINWADYVFCFDENNYFYLMDHYRKYRNKIYLLGSFDYTDKKTVFIEDPYEMDINEKGKIIERIANIVREWLI